MKLIASLTKAHFCLSVMTWKTNCMEMKNLDLEICCGGIFFDVESIGFVFSEGTLSSRISKSS